MGCGEAVKRVCSGGRIKFLSLSDNFSTSSDSTGFGSMGFCCGVEVEMSSGCDVGVFEMEVAEAERRSAFESVREWRRDGREDVFCDCRYGTMLRIFPGLDERVIIVVTPAEVARRAATILVDMPPVPRREPADDTITKTNQLSFLANPAPDLQDEYKANFTGRQKMNG